MRDFVSEHEDWMDAEQEEKAADWDEYAEKHIHTCEICGQEFDDTEEQGYRVGDTDRYVCGHCYDELEEIESEE